LRLLTIQNTGYLMGYIYDFNQFSRVIHQLKEFRRFSNNVLDNSPIPTWVANFDKSILYVNSAMEDKTGFSRSYLIGEKPPYPFWPEDCIDEYMEDLHDSFNQGLRGTLRKLCRKNGDILWVEIYSKAIKENGYLKYYISSWVDLTYERHLQEDLQFYIAEVTKAQEEERRRIARDLHDETAQSLAILCGEVKQIIEHSDTDNEVLARLRRIPESIEAILHDVRVISNNLRPALLEKLGLISSLTMLAKEAEEKGRLNCGVETDGSKRRLPPDIELTLFRIVQEALSNVIKHAHASSVSIRLVYNDSDIELNVADDGCGFKTPSHWAALSREGKLGIMNISERVRLFGGNLIIESALGEGSTLKVSIPISVSGHPKPAREGQVKIRHLG